jgi:Na+/melibiose symporter-like transporter
VRTLWRTLAGHRDLRLLLAAGLISLTGDWILRTGLAYYVYVLTGSTLASATTLLASLVPQIALASPAGVYVDRWDRRTTMVVTNVLLATTLLPLLVVHSRHQVWVIYLVLVVQSCLAQFFTAAEAALLPHTVPATDLLTANALNGQNNDIARLVGAALGGVTVGLGGVTALSIADALSFALAAVLVSLVRSRRADAERPAAARHLLRELRQGAALAARSATLRLLLLFVLIVALGEGVFGTLIAPFVRDVLHGSAQAYGLILSSQAAGGIVGGLLVATVARRFDPRRLIGWGAFAFGLVDLALFLYPLLTRSLWPAVALVVVAGLPGALTLAGMVTVFQNATADAHRGRVFGLSAAVQGAAMLVGALASGALGSHLGIIPVLVVQGAGYCIAGILMLLFLPPAESPATDSQPGTPSRPPSGTTSLKLGSTAKP